MKFISDITKEVTASPFNISCDVCGKIPAIIEIISDRGTLSLNIECGDCGNDIITRSVGD